MRRSVILLPNPLRPAAHGGLTIARHYAMHFMAALFPLTAGLMLYGWRAAWTVGIVLLSAAGAVVVWRRVGSMGHQLRLSHSLWLATLLALMLPPHLATLSPGVTGVVAWPVMTAGGMILVMLLWMLGGLGAGRVHPVLLTYLFLNVLFHQELAPRFALQRDRLVTGDVLLADPSESGISPEPWVRRPRADRYDAAKAPSTADRLIAYTRGKMVAERGLLRLQGLISDQLPPLEDLVVGGQPGPIGTSSAVAVIVGGLFLLYRGLIDHRIPLVMVTTTYLLLLVLPIPARFVEDWPQWSWLVVREGDVDWATALTFVHYEMMASPLLFTALFLATAPSIRPLTRRGRVVYALVAGALAAPAQLYISVSVGPYLALFAASLLTPLLDRWMGPTPLV
jgi:Na+-translocating ferredoxin:NAD+ oxidoreductase RnfD subunit